MSTKLAIHGQKVKGVYDDRLLPIYQALGDMRISKSSIVYFDNLNAEWVALDYDTADEIARDPLRTGVIEKEIKFLEEKL